MLQNLPYFGILQKKLPCLSRSSSISKAKNKLAGKEKNMKTTSYVPIVVLEFLHSKIFGNY